MLAPWHWTSLNTGYTAMLHSDEGFKAYLNLPIRNIHWFPATINERLNYDNFAELDNTTKAILESNEVTRGIRRPTTV